FHWCSACDHPQGKCRVCRVPQRACKHRRRRDQIERTAHFRAGVHGLGHLTAVFTGDAHRVLVVALHRTTAARSAFFSWGAGITVDTRVTVDAGITVDARVTVDAWLTVQPIFTGVPLSTLSTRLA